MIIYDTYRPRRLDGPARPLGPPLFLLKSPLRFLRIFGFLQFLENRKKTCFFLHFCTDFCHFRIDLCAGMYENGQNICFIESEMKFCIEPLSNHLILSTFR